MTPYLSRCLTSQGEFEATSHLISPEYFPSRDRQIFEAMQAAQDGGDLVTVLSVTRILREQGKRLSTEEMLSLAQASEGITTTDLAEQVRIDYQSSQAELIGSWLTRGTATIPTAVSALEQVLESTELAGTSDLESLYLASREKMIARKEAMSEGGKIPGVLYSGITVLDQEFFFETGQTVVIGGRPGSGKSSFVRTLASSFGKDGIPIILFSLEMSPTQILTQMICAEAGVDSNRVKVGNVSAEEIAKFDRAAGKVLAYPLMISGITSIQSMRAEIESWAREKGDKEGAIITDYIQQVKDPSKRYSRPDLEIGEVSRILMLQAKKSNCCNIICAQLNRGLESRADKRPVASDLRESGNLEQDADVILFLYRPEMYGDHIDDNGNSTQFLTELICRKNRWGPTGTFLIRFFPHLARFGSWTGAVSQAPF